MSQELLGAKLTLTLPKSHIALEHLSKKEKSSSLAVAWGTFSLPTELAELVPTAG